jgi:hypothetical protein
VKLALSVALLFYSCGSSTPVKPPTPPPTVSVGAAFNWTEETPGVTNFIVLRNGAQIGTTKALNYLDTPLAAGTYTYTIEACIDSTCSIPSNPGTLVVP